VYYVLTYETFSETEAQQLPRPKLPGRDDLAFDDGIPVQDPPQRVRFIMTRSERGDLGDYVLSGMPGLLISERFRLALEKGGVDNVQYIPADIEDQIGGQTYSNYFMANVIGIVDCIDMSKSKLTMRAALPDKIRDIDELHIDEPRACDLPLFRLARKSTLVLINESLQKVLAAAALRGVGLTPAEGFST